MCIRDRLIICSCSDDDNADSRNNAPVISDQTFTVAENIADNMAIGTVIASHPDNDALTFSISVNDNGLFEITEDGELSLDDLQNLDFETAQSHNITVQVSDGIATTDAIITIIITDVEDSSFITTWETSTSNETVVVTVPAPQFIFDYTIDWGDGTIETNITGDATHSYAMPDTYTISISGTFPGIIIQNNATSQTQLRTIEQWGTIVWRTMDFAFAGIENGLTITATDVPDLSRVTSMSTTFFNTDIEGDLNTWDVSTITSMSRMFNESSFNQDISNWDVSNVTDMSGMFDQSLFNQDISSWDVSNVTNMSFMFDRSSFNQDIGNWDVSNVTNMSWMFRGFSFNQDISDWDVSNVTDMSFMFLNSSSFNQDIGNWDVSNVTDMTAMFQNAIFNQDISNWDVSNVTNCSAFLEGASLTEGNTPNFTNCIP